MFEFGFDKKSENMIKFLLLSYFVVSKYKS